MHRLARLGATLLICGWAVAGLAQPRLALIVDDLGEQRAAGARALGLPAAVALSYLPDTPHGQAQSARAAAKGHEILLHLPLQAEDPGRNDARALRVEAPSADISRRLREALAQLPQAVGVNNHQGSRFTADYDAVDALMRALRRQPDARYFIDSRTTAATRAFALARAHGIPAAERQVFIDPHRGEAAVAEGLQRWLRHARRHGSALAIAHPYPETLAALENILPRLHALGFQLVPPSALLEGSKALSARATSRSGQAAR